MTCSSPFHPARPHRFPYPPVRALLIHPATRACPSRPHPAGCVSLPRPRPAGCVPCPSPLRPCGPILSTHPPVRASPLYPSARAASPLPLSARACPAHPPRHPCVPRRSTHPPVPVHPLPSCVSPFVPFVPFVAKLPSYLSPLGGADRHTADRHPTLRLPYHCR